MWLTCKPTLGRKPTASRRSAPNPKLEEHAGRNMLPLIVPMSSDRLSLDRVGRHHCPSPFRRHEQINTHSQRHGCKGDISTLCRLGTFLLCVDTSGHRGLSLGYYSGRIDCSQPIDCPQASEEIVIRYLAALLLPFLLIPFAACGAIAIDANVSIDRTTKATTVATPTFSTTLGNELLLAFVSTDYISGANTTVRSVSGAGLTWSLVVRSNTQRGTSEIWRAFAPAPVNNVIVTATLSQSVLSSIVVISYSGVNTSGTNGSGAIGATAAKSAATGPPSATLVTTQDNSWIFGVGNDYDNAIPRTVGAGQTLVHQFLTFVGDTYWVQRQNAPTSFAGTSVTINDTAPTADRYNLAICEIIAAVSAVSTYSISGTITGGGGSTVTLSGAASASVPADSSGNYTFANLANGSYTITPSKTGFTFTPATRSVVVSGANQSSVDFTAQPLPTYSISGTITGGGGSTVTLSGTASANVPADSSGNYTFANLANGSYTITPSKAGFAFTPATRSVVLNGANQTGADFTAQILASSSIQMVQKNVNGNESSGSSMSVAFPANNTQGNFLIVTGTAARPANTLSLSDTAGNTYLPAIGPMIDPAQDVTVYVWYVPDCKGSPNTVTITPSTASALEIHVSEWSGVAKISSLDQISFATGNSASVSSGSKVTTADGELIFGYGWVVNNATSGPGFTPLSLVNGDLTEYQIQNSAGSVAATFTQTSAPWLAIMVTFRAAPALSISGTISPAADGSGATVTLSGAASATTMADAVGKYTFSGIGNGSYAVAVSKSGYSFSPASQPVTVNGATVTSIDFTAAAAPTWSISGSITPAAGGIGATVALSGAASATTVADALGNFTFTGVASGSYTVTPSKNGYSFSPASQPVAMSGTDVTDVSFTAQAVVSTTLSIGVNISTDKGTASTTVSTPQFSTASGNQLLLAFVATDYVSAANTTVTSISGAGLTWALVVRANGQSGTSEIWRAFAPTLLSNVTVTATLSQSVSSSLTLMSFTGVDTSGTNGSGAIGAIASKSAATGAPSATLVTTRNNSWVVGVGNDYDNSVARTLGAGQSLVHQYLAPVGDTYWVQKQNATTALSGTNTTINDTAPTADRYNLAICEILPTATSGGVTTWTISGTISPVVAGAGATVSVSGAAATTTTADSAGKYSLAGLTNGSYTVTPSQGGYGFSPANQTVNISGASVSGINFTGSTSPATVGQFSSVMNWPIVPLNAVLMNTGKVLIYDRPSAGPTARVWDPATNTFTSVPNNFTDIFCSGHSALADGRILVIGGHGSVHTGSSDVNLFDPATQTWTLMPRMAYERWYPTATTLPDGRVLAITGAAVTDKDYIKIPEIYNPATNSWTQLTVASVTLPTYGQFFVLPNGKVGYTGNTEFPDNARTLDVNTQTWTTVDANIIDGYSVMYQPGKVLKTGSAADSGTSGSSSNAANLIDFTAVTPAWQSVAPMSFARTHHNLTILPDGNVLVVGGGTTKDGYYVENAVYAAEMWSPVTKTWTTMASGAKPRLYHSVGLLLPDGRVLVAGGGRDGAAIDQLNAEIYSPPYLFKGARPVIRSAPDIVAYGGSFFVDTPDSLGISSVALMKLGATTHGFDQDQRFQNLSFAQNGGGLQIQAPANANLAPPGYYMLFLVNSNGVPSVAKILKIN
jgi:hypothetical protein